MCISVPTMLECVCLCVVSMMESASHISVCVSLCIDDYALCESGNYVGMCIACTPMTFDPTKM